MILFSRYLDLVGMTSFICVFLKYQICARKYRDASEGQCGIVGTVLILETHALLLICYVTLKIYLSTQAISFFICKIRIVGLLCRNL